MTGSIPSLMTSVNDDQIEEMIQHLVLTELLGMAWSDFDLEECILPSLRREETKMWADSITTAGARNAWLTDAIS